MRNCPEFAGRSPLKKHLLLFFSSAVYVFAINLALSAQTSEREKPRLIVFGASLKPDYVKPKPTAKNSTSAQNDDVISIDTNLVMNDVLIIDEKGFAVNNLSKDDFLITEDGAAQKVDFFQPGSQSNVPRSIVLVLDYSGSLRPYIKTSVAAAKTLVDKLNPLDKMAIVTDDVELITDFTRDKNILKEKLDALELKALNTRGGRSKQYSALYAALNELFDVENVRSIVIFQTDGDEFPFLKNNSSQMPPEIAGVYSTQIERITNFTYQDLVSATEKARATVYTVIPGLRFLGISPDEMMQQGRLYSDGLQSLRPPRPASKASQAILEKRAEMNARFFATFFSTTHKSIVSTAITSGGWAQYLETPEKADELYNKILNDINNRYILGFYPLNQTRDGKRRTVKVEIRNHPEYKIFTRRSYYAPEN